MQGLKANKHTSKPPNLRKIPTPYLEFRGPGLPAHQEPPASLELCGGIFGGAETGPPPASCPLQLSVGVFLPLFSLLLGPAVPTHPDQGWPYKHGTYSQACPDSTLIRAGACRSPCPGILCLVHQFHQQWLGPVNTEAFRF